MYRTATAAEGVRAKRYEGAREMMKCGNIYIGEPGESSHSCVLPKGHAGTHANTELPIDSPEQIGIYWRDEAEPSSPEPNEEHLISVSTAAMAICNMCAGSVEGIQKEPVLQKDWTRGDGHLPLWHPVVTPDYIGPWTRCAASAIWSLCPEALPVPSDLEEEEAAYKRGGGK